MHRRRPPRKPATARELVVTIERLAAGGDGVSRLDDGRTLFVPLSAPGDRVRVRVVDERRRFARAEILELIEASADRVEPRCAVFGRCGGCAWQHLDYAVQVDAKQSIIRDALQRIGGFDVPEDIAFSGSPSAYGYRQRARVMSAQGEVGYRARRSHELCATRSCPVLLPALEGELARLAREGVPGRTGFASADGDEWELSAGTAGVRTVPLPVQVGEPAGSVAMRVRGDELQISPGVFVQANGLLLDALVQAVCDAALPATDLPGEASTAQAPAVLELYAGAGSLTLELARRAGAFLAIESNPASARDLRANLETAGLHDVEVRCEPTEAALARDLAFDAQVVVLDPPRAGIGEEGAIALAGLRPARIAYLSCDPATLARDLRVLREHGYRLDHVEGFDLFPQTAHVEALCVMTRTADAP